MFLFSFAKLYQKNDSANILILFLMNCFHFVMFIDLYQVFCYYLTI
jgi:hypothetical protein